MNEVDEEENEDLFDSEISRKREEALDYFLAQENVGLEQATENWGHLWPPCFDQIQLQFLASFGETEPAFASISTVRGLVELIAWRYEVPNRGFGLPEVLRARERLEGLDPVRRQIISLCDETGEHHYVRRSAPELLDVLIADRVAAYDEDAFYEEGFAGAYAGSDYEQEHARMLQLYEEYLCGIENAESFLLESPTFQQAADVARHLSRSKSVDAKIRSVGSCWEVYVPHKERRKIDLQFLLAELGLRSITDPYDDE